jgi:hypothetical protein
MNNKNKIKFCWEGGASKLCFCVRALKSHGFICLSTDLVQSAAASNNYTLALHTHDLKKKNFLSATFVSIRLDECVFFSSFLLYSFHFVVGCCIAVEDATQIYNIGQLYFSCTYEYLLVISKQGFYLFLHYK